MIAIKITTGAREFDRIVVDQSRPCRAI
jgi:hypothetical protein